MNTSALPASSVVPVLPLKNSVLFPEMMMPLAIGRAMSVAAVEEASSGEDKMLVIVSQKNPAVEEPTYEDLFHIGTLAVIKKMEQGPLGLQVIVQGLTRVMLEQDESGPDSRFLKAAVREMPPPDDAGTEVDALHRIILEQVDKIISMTEPQAQAGMSRIFAQFKDPLETGLSSGIPVANRPGEGASDPVSHNAGRRPATDGGIYHARGQCPGVATEDCIAGPE